MLNPPESSSKAFEEGARFPVVLPRPQEAQRFTSASCRYLPPPICRARRRTETYCSSSGTRPSAAFRRGSVGCCSTASRIRKDTSSGPR
ncbi:unnamed protein product, partial [Effrenium voratum]